ncbi:hypothetical protein FRX31_009613 [Thalictrum thalictroides]|uniref:Uncharacterized protein n=1 Tax=Thalictrum thalictroides TaxID=46969 RepID=A0A7J6WVN5_THATH|nr:hypothetical protein FRX31_009613 [Thalictrum thalictroides]
MVMAICVECYNPTSNKWSSCFPLSEMKGCLAGTTLNNKLYAVGGGNGKDCFRLSGQLKCSIQCLEGGLRRSQCYRRWDEKYMLLIHKDHANLLIMLSKCM